MAEPMPRSPEWWVKKLNAELDKRNAKISLFNDYYEGNHPLPRAPERAKGAFRRWLRMSRSNWMALVVETKAERLAVQGIRYGKDQSADEDAWRLWQANGLDTGSGMVHLEALINGESYMLVAPDPAGGDIPLMLPEHPTQMIVARDPARPGQRAAAFKKWLDDTGVVNGTLYLPDAIWKIQSDRPVREGQDLKTIRWEPREVADEEYPLPNPIGEVPVVPFRNRARLLGPGRSELDGVTDTQDRINETLFQRVMAGQYSAFRQRYVTGLDVEMDEETGLPKKPFEPNASELWFTSNPEARFGDFAETSLDGYLSSIAADVQHIAAQTSTPPHYLLGEMVNLAAEALKAAEASLISKVRDRQKQFGESWEEVFRLAFTLMNDERSSIVDAEMIWQNPEFRTEGQLVDALTKMATLGVPRKVLWERWGASPQEIARWDAMGVADALTAGLLPQPAPTATPVPQAG